MFCFNDDTAIQCEFIKLQRAVNSLTSSALLSEKSQRHQLNFNIDDFHHATATAVVANITSSF